MAKPGPKIKIKGPNPPTIPVSAARSTLKKKQKQPAKSASKRRRKTKDNNIQEEEGEEGDSTSEADEDEEDEGRRRSTQDDEDGEEPNGDEDQPNGDGDEDQPNGDEDEPNGDEDEPNGDEDEPDDEDENVPPIAQARLIRKGNSSLGKRPRSAFQLSRPKRVKFGSDPLIHYGRHFGRSMHAMCSVYNLLVNGVSRAIDPENTDGPAIGTTESQREEKIYRELLGMVPGLEQRLMEGISEEQLRMIAESLQKGTNGARADDTKSLKAAVIDWLTPYGVPLVPPLSRNVKSDRGFFHEATGKLLCPADMDWKDPAVKAQLKAADYIVPGDQWPILVYKDYKYNAEDAWEGLFRSKILLLAYKHIFTSPSSASREPRATRSGNARIHGMKSVTIPSLAYAATLLRFSLCSTSVFSSMDRITDSHRFYISIVEFLEDPDEHVEVADLLEFWNHQIFPEYAGSKLLMSRNSALSALRMRRALLNTRDVASS